jgi:LL-diaminopimelate aminotransferase
MEFNPSERLGRLPPYLFAELERKQKTLREQGKDIINLGIGDPDQPAPDRVLKKLVESFSEPGIHQYSSTQGRDEFRAAVCEFMSRRHGARLEPREVCLGVGSKEIIAHIPLALTDPGDAVLIPEPGYPPYRSGTIFALCEPFVMPLRRENGFLPDLDSIPRDVLQRAKILYVNYPNNPTAAVATKEFYARLVEFARRHSLLVVSDEAYSELFYEDPPVSFLSVDGAKEVGIAVHSMTKTANMAGWRVAWVAGNAQVVEILRGFKANCDSGQFMGFQLAVADFLRNGESEMKKIRDMYRERRELFIAGMRRIGWDVPTPRATFYVWFPTPGGISSMDFTNLLLERANVVMTPGSGFGAFGEGFMRVALTQSSARLREAVERISALKL